jgi:hypothetical protein
MRGFAVLFLLASLFGPFRVEVAHADPRPFFLMSFDDFTPEGRPQNGVHHGSAFVLKNPAGPGIVLATTGQNIFDDHGKAWAEHLLLITPEGAQIVLSLKEDLIFAEKSGAGDLAFLRVPQTPETHANRYALAGDAPVEGQTVAAAGYADALCATESWNLTHTLPLSTQARLTGCVAPRVRTGEHTVAFLGEPRQVGKGQTSVGATGGPVTDAHGKVVGALVSGYAQGVEFDARGNVSAGQDSGAYTYVPLTPESVSALIVPGGRPVLVEPTTDEALASNAPGITK